MLNQWAKEWTVQKKIKASKGSRGSPTSKNAPQHVADADMVLDPDEVAKHLKMKDPNWESYKKASPFYMTSQTQKMTAEQDGGEDTGPKIPKQRRIAKTPPPPEKKGKTKEELLAWFKSSREEHMERFRQPETKQEEIERGSTADAQVEVPLSGQEPNCFGSGCLRERPRERQAKAEESTADSSCQYVASQDAAREAKKGKGKRYPTPTSEPSEGEGDPLALKSLELAPIEAPMAHQATLDSGPATSCIPVELAASLACSA